MHVVKMKTEHRQLLLRKVIAKYVISSFVIACKLLFISSNVLYILCDWLKAGTWGSGQSAAGGVDLALRTARSSVARSHMFTPTGQKPRLVLDQSGAGCLTGLWPNQYVSWISAASGRYDLSGARWDIILTLLWVCKIGRDGMFK